MGYLLGIDVGTTNIKAVVYDPAVGRVLAVASRPNVTHHPLPGRSEFDPAELWQCVVQTVREVTAGRADDVDAVAVASFAEAGVPIDRSGRYLYPIIAFHDPRSEPQSRYWFDWLGNERVYEITGQPIQYKFTVCKLLWLKENEPEVFGAMHKWLCAEDFTLWKLSDAFATDFSIASRTMAFDQRRKDWSAEILDYVGLAPEAFARPHQAGTLVGEVTQRAAAETGLRAGTPVATGGHDHPCGALASGAVSAGALLNSMGTAEACLVISDEFRPEPRLAAAGNSHYAYVVPNQYVLHFGLTASGGILEWLVRHLCPEADESAEGRHKAFAELMAAADAVAPGSEGLVWLPHLNGVGSPWADERSRASVVGYAPGHGRGHTVRALLEGLCYWMRENLESLMEVADVPSEREITAIGGGSRNPLWMQIKADVTRRRVRVVDVPEAVAVGAALLAGVGAGVFPSHAAAAATVDRSAVTMYAPDPARAAVYDAYYTGVFKHLYPALRDVNHRIHDTVARRRG